MFNCLSMDATRSWCVKHCNLLHILLVFLRLDQGFRSKRSCETQLIEFVADITKNSAGKQTDILIMDFSKAFDKVSHSLLLHKLEHYGIRGNINRRIASFLYNRTQAVVVDGESSTHIDVESGDHKDPYLGHHYSCFTSTTCLRE